MQKVRKAKVLLIGAEDEENLSIRYLAAVLEKDGHDVKIAPCSRYEQFPQVIKTVNKYNPDLIGISIAFQSLAKMYFELVSKICELNRGGYITVGGHFPTFEFRNILETQRGIDSVIRFEGEQAIVELANFAMGNFKLSSVTNLVYRTPGGIHENECIRKFPALDELPFPVRNKKPQIRLGENFATLVASRGCWYSSCLYCCIGAFHSEKKGKRFVVRSPENIADELRVLYRKFGSRLFQFHDDNFMLPSKKETAKRLADIKKAVEEKNIKTKNIAFLIKARPDTIDDEVAFALKELGVVGVFLGIENATESGLKALRRGTTLENIYQAISSLKKFDIEITFNLLIFHPNATLDEIDKNIDFLQNNIQYPFDFGRAEVVAGSPLEKMLIEKNGLIGSWPNWDYGMDDKLVEKMFKINLFSFRRKNAYYSRLAHSSIALGYHAYVLKRLHPGPIADKLFLDANELIKQINGFIIDQIKKMRFLAINSSPDEDIRKFYEELSTGCQNFLRFVWRLNSRIRRLQIAENVCQFFEARPLVQEVYPSINKIFKGFLYRS